MEATRGNRSAAAALAAASLQLGGDEDARRDAGLLLQFVWKRERAWLFAHPEEVLSAEVAARFDEAVARRARGEPVHYVTGEAWFYGRRFFVSPAVLVPRPETEQLVEAALEYLDGRSRPSSLRVCDVGTGSGILAITLACERPALELTALDRSDEALAVARRNADALGVAARIRFCASDLFEAVAPAERFDCVVANLPYVRSGALHPAPDPTSFEPRLALDGGPDGLAVYRRLLGMLAERLEPGAGVFLEAAPDTAGPLAALAGERFPQRSCSLLRDYAGLERIVALTG
jgi:release factor glutamine methyltransferase